VSERERKKLQTERQRQRQRQREIETGRETEISALRAHRKVLGEARQQDAKVCFVVAGPLAARRAGQLQLKRCHNGPVELCRVDLKQPCVIIRE
jgi:hypothetical protein